MTRKVLALVLALAMMIPAFAMAEAADPYGKYAEPITITTLTTDQKTTATEYDVNNPDRKSAHENAWITAYKDYLGIEIKREIAEDDTALNARLNTGMASGDLPDVMIVDKSMFFVLAENGVLKDLKPVWEEVGANYPLLNDALSGWNGALETGMYEGEMLGWPMLPNCFNNTTTMWIRKDWLDKVGMEIPTTLDELEAVGKAFIEAGLGGENTYAWNTTQGAFQWICEAYGTPYHNENTFVEVEDGKYIYAGVNTEPVKAALLRMQQWYKDGLLSKDVVVDDSKVAAEDIANGRVGIHFCEPWHGTVNIKASNLNDPEADWVCARIPTLTGEDVKQWTNATVGSFIVVNSECENPEAIFKMLELELHIYYYATPEESVKLYLGEDGYAIWDFRIFRNFGYPNTDFRRMQECLDGKAAGLTEVSAFSNANYQRLLQGEAGNREQVGFGRIMTQGYPIVDALNKAGMLFPEYGGPITENMTLYQKNIAEALTAAMFKVVIGEDISVYEKAVETWYASGGQAITDEVNAYYAANK